MSQRKARKIAVIGTINRDTVIRADGSKIEGYGGILYNLTVLSRLLGRRAEIFPVANLGADHDKEIRKRLREFANLELSALATVAAANNHCRLTYKSVSEKAEVLSGWVGGVKREKLKSIVDADFILVNFISGSDISTANLKWLSGQTDAVTYMDFHSRTLGRKADGRRFLRRPRDWRETVRCADILQMNDVEFRLLAGAEPSLDECAKFMRATMSRTAEALLVTLGSRGCLVCERCKSGLMAELVPAPRLGKVLDTTGCGDVFAGALLASRAMNKSMIDSAMFAVMVASARAAKNGIEQIEYGRLVELLEGRNVAK